MRVVSLLPAATEIVAALGLGDALVGVSHECDYPPSVEQKPRVTRCEIYNKGLASAAIEHWVNRQVAEDAPLYTIDTELLRSLEADVIVTQQLCNVCAIDYASVATLTQSLAKRPRIVNLSPSSLEDIFGDIGTLAAALGVTDRAHALVRDLRDRVERVRHTAARAKSQPRCLLMEWIDPPYCAGHWNPELIEIAGGTPALGRKHVPSVRVTWEQIEAAAPDVVVLACCGHDVERTLGDVHLLDARPEWTRLPAVERESVYVVNASAYFSRPGPRVVDSLEILAEIMHPELFSGFIEARAVRRLDVSASRERKIEARASA